MTGTGSFVRLGSLRSFSRAWPCTSRTSFRSFGRSGTPPTGNKVDNDFWASIYKVDNGSGGPYNNGWFNNFYAHHYGMDYRTRQFVANFKNEQGSYDYTLMDGNGYKISEYNNQGYFPGKRGGGRYGGPKLNNFPSNLSNVPFTWKYLGSEIPMAFVGGVTGVEMVDGFLTPRLGISVVELNSTKKGAK
jgi:hypothetical protein